VLGALAGVAGIVLTIFAVKLGGSGSENSFTSFLKHAAHAPALYLACGGFLLIAIGALIGPSKRTRTV
jgi:hypothetical protein